MNEPFKLFVQRGFQGSFKDEFGSGGVPATSFNTIELTDISGVIVQYTGFEPPAASLYTSNLAGVNGSVYQGSRIPTRNIVLSFHILWNNEDNRMLLYQYFRTGEIVRLYYLGTRNCWIDGHVETVRINRFQESKKQVMQVSILCADPLLKAIDEIETPLNSALGDEFTQVNYGGEYPDGIKIKITFSGACTMPQVQNLFDENPDEPVVPMGGGVTVDDSFIADDVLLIDTHPGNKSIVRVRNNTKTNLMSKLHLPAHWPNIYPGNNTFMCSAWENQANMSVKITIREVYGGV